MMDEFEQDDLSWLDLDGVSGNKRGEGKEKGAEEDGNGNGNGNGNGDRDGGKSICGALNETENGKGLP
jgi:hypothetical protein